MVQPTQLFRLGSRFLNVLDDHKRNKGHVLESFFRGRPNIATCYDAVVVIDADTLVDENILLDRIIFAIKLGVFRLDSMLLHGAKSG